MGSEGEDQPDNEHDFGVRHDNGANRPAIPGCADAAAQNLHHPGQSAWCRQLDPEHEGTMLRKSVLKRRLQSSGKELVSPNPLKTPAGRASSCSLTFLI
jgi:hypothetical protein